MQIWKTMLSKLGCQGNVIVELQITTTLKFSLKTVEKSLSFAVIAWIFFNEFNGASHTLIQRKISSSFKTVKKSRIHLAKKTYSLPPRQAESNCSDRWGIYEKGGNPIVMFQVQADYIWPLMLKRNGGKISLNVLF